MLRRIETLFDDLYILNHKHLFFVFMRYIPSKMYNNTLIYFFIPIKRPKNKFSGISRLCSLHSTIVGRYNIICF